MSIPGKEVTTETAVRVDGNGGQMVATEVVIERTRSQGKKKKRKTSKGLKNLDKAHDNASRAMEHLSASVSDGLKTYRREQKASAEKKKDGALRDLMKNSGKAASDSLKTLSKVPLDLTRTIDNKRNRKQVRAVARFIAGPLGR
ncbi:hypothetical protein HUA74_40030 [Myxococcus sp. CA051A]|uniref:Uncharacterized protein n=1 Tax=Myxococcus llanfairpwllgwyngyllgogerychwyrndrobwllllantysiliogogogochensis TaxID=2590453 RepID=A0A540WMQ9_9BACT|nr:MULTISPECIES: hypothetical protein [Myxococcus]NTX01527.1 hypothetical protein [Myxococcus sp. CA040A]NTX16816.1 hypothetical protein [Myxococcus sp. CA056]NTX41408.1 hypothetical protein [Myxococcus sp. CA033]NTX53883.1 hypothetical protein [Myxococcus sp. CA039A]NTX66856.1 hypothetical protein [Myxococcus sp. CA051A]